MGDRTGIISGCEDDAIGLEVHVDGWGPGPFFTVRGFQREGSRVCLSKRYSRRIKYTVDADAVYFTKRSAKVYGERVGTAAVSKER